LLSVSVVRALEQWSLMAEKISAGQKEQMKNTIDLLSSSLIRVSHGSEKSAKSLKIIQGELESACRMDDLAAVNAKLRLCVKEICDEAERQSRRQSAIQNDLKDAVKLAPAASDVDAVTGLASVQSAIQAIHRSWE